MAGLTDQGFEKKTYDEIVTDLENSVRGSSQFGTSAQTHAASVIGQLLRVFALALSYIWDALLAVYQAFDIASAKGAALDNLLVLAGSARLPATSSTATVTLTGQSGATISAGFLFRIPDTDYQFSLDSDVILTGGTGTGTVTCTVTGPVLVAEDTITEPVTVSAALDTVTNDAGTTGRNIESDSDARTRLRVLLKDPEGAGTDSLYTRIGALDGIESVRVYENDTSTTDGDGRPTKSFEVIIHGSGYTVADLVQLIWTYKPAGIRTYGLTSSTVTDSQGQSRTIYYTVATALDIYVTVVVTTDNEYPDDGDDQVAAAVLAAGEDDAGMGRDVIFGRVVRAVYSIPGITDATITIGTTPSPVGTSNVTVGVREYPSWDLSHISVTS